MRTDRGTQGDLIAALQMIVPMNRETLTTAEHKALGEVTEALVDIAAAAGQREFRRFQDTKSRGLSVDPAALDASHRGRTVLVTGGTGCIGSRLLAELTRLGPGRLISISRGVSTPWTVVDGVEYRYIDIRDRAGLLDLFAELKPDIVYHLAAQHDPGLAEIEVARTVSTNVTGSANVLDACRRVDAKMIHASTGKALRPFSSDIYAASKKLSEWLVADAMADGGLRAAAARFTHVVDNSIIVDRFRMWTDAGLPIRLHSPDISFYLQSALEAANLLMCAGLDATRDNLRLGAIRNLGWPISLLELAVGWLTTGHYASPIYVCGFEAGYADNPYPALYDPHHSGDRSPLLNATEVPGAATSPHCFEVDLATVEPRSDARVRGLIGELGRAADANARPDILRSHIRDCGWAMLVSTFESLPTAVLSRHVDFVRSITPSRFSSDDLQVVDMARRELRRRRRTRSHPDQTAQPARIASMTGGGT